MKAFVTTIVFLLPISVIAEPWVSFVIPDQICSASRYLNFGSTIPVEPDTFIRDFHDGQGTRLERVEVRKGSDGKFYNIRSEYNKLGNLNHYEEWRGHDLLKFERLVNLYDQQNRLLKIETYDENAHRIKIVEYEYPTADMIRISISSFTPSEDEVDDANYNGPPQHLEITKKLSDGRVFSKFITSNAQGAPVVIEEKDEHGLKSKTEFTYGSSGKRKSLRLVVPREMREQIMNWDYDDQGTLTRYESIEGAIFWKASQKYDRNSAGQIIARHETGEYSTGGFPSEARYEDHFYSYDSKQRLIEDRQVNKSADGKISSVSGFTYDFSCLN